MSFDLRRLGLALANKLRGSQSQSKMFSWLGGGHTLRMMTTPLQTAIPTIPRPRTFSGRTIATTNRPAQNDGDNSVLDSILATEYKVNFSDDSRGLLTIPTIVYVGAVELTLGHIHRCRSYLLRGETILFFVH